MKSLVENSFFEKIPDIIDNAAMIQKQVKKIKTHLIPAETKSKFHEKVVIVTGASSGIGRATAIEFAQKGAKVVLASRNKEALVELMEYINKTGGLAMAFPTDVTQQAECQQLIENTIHTFGKIDILINNAGISMRANFNELDLYVLKRVFDTNFWGAVYCTKYALPHLIENQGSIVGISSICGITPLPGRTGYSASKHALDGFLESLRLENVDNGLHVLTVHPGFTTSNIRNVALNEEGEIQKDSPLDEDKLMSAETVAASISEAVIHRKRDIVLSREGRIITWIYRNLPNIADRLIYNQMKKELNAPF